MRCQNCHEEIPDTAKACFRCEAPVVPAPTKEETDAAHQVLGQMTPEMMAELHQAMIECSTREDFVNRVLLGECPTCGSSKTGDCEHDPEINEILVARCYDCGQLWCAECTELLDPKALFCECWNESWEDEAANE